MATARERLSQIRQQTAKERLTQLRQGKKKPPQEDFARPSMEWGSDLVTSTEPTAIQKAATGGVLGLAGGTLKGAGAITQLATGGRAGGTLARAGELATTKGAEVAPVSTFVGEVAAPVAGVKKASKILDIAKKGESFIRKALKAAGIGAVAVPAAMPVKDADQMSVADFYAEKGGEAALGAIGGAALFGAGKVAGTAANRLMDLVGNRTVRQARDIIEKYKVKTLEDLDKAIKTEDAALAKTRSQREQIASGQVKREARAEAKVTPAVPRERQRVLDVAREKERLAQQSLADAQARSVAANDAIADLETRLKGDPTEKVTLGRMVRQIATNIKEKGTAYRNTKAKFKETVDNAPADPIIPTINVGTTVRKYLKDINNPVEEKLFTDISARLGGKEARLSVRSADSLKDYLNTIIETKMHGNTPIDKNIRSKVIELRNQIVKDLGDYYSPYRKAMEEYGPASRPLDIVERNGSLKKVLDQDPLSKEYKLSESEVVGSIIQRAQKGSQVFSRLMTENPEIQEPARLYFTRDLLGRGSPPTPAQFKTWLKNNEGALRQLGLYEEFSTLARSRITAQNAVEVAKGLAEEAAGKRKAAATYVERTARGQVTPEQLRVPAEKRAAEKTKELTRKETDLAKRADAFRRIDARLRASRPEDVTTEASTMIENLRAGGLIDDAQYTNMIRELRRIQTTEAIGRRAEQVRNVIYAGVLGTAVGGGALGYLLRGGPETTNLPVQD
jgi:hypothetical protein